MDIETLQKMNCIPQNLKVIRSALRISQQDFAKKLGTTRDILSNYEQGRTDVPLEIFTKLAGITGITIDFLMYQPVTAAQVTGEPQADYTQMRNLYDIRDLVEEVKALVKRVEDLENKGK